MSTEPRDDPDDDALPAATPRLVSAGSEARSRSGWIRAGTFCILLGLVSTIAITQIGAWWAPMSKTSDRFAVTPDVDRYLKNRRIPLTHGESNWLVFTSVTVTAVTSGNEVIVSIECRYGWPFRTVRVVSNHTRPASIPRTGWVGFVVHPAGWTVLWMGLVADGMFFAALWFLVLHFRSARRQFKEWIARRRAGRCPDCNYDLRGCPEAGCPECGWGRGESGPDDL